MLLPAAPAGAAALWLAPVDVSVPGQAGQNASGGRVAVDAQGNAVAVWYRYNGTNFIVQGAVRPAGGVWRAPVDLSVANGDAVGPQVAVDSQGNAVAVWQRSNGANYIVQGAVRPAASGVWQAPVDLSIPGGDATDSQVAVDAAGNAVAVWMRFNSTKYIVQSAVRLAASGVWQAPVDLSAANLSASGPQVSVDPQGNAVAVWMRDNGANYVVQGAVRPASSGLWQAPVDLSAGGGSDPEVAIDSQGNAVAVWERSNGANYIVQAAVRPAAGAVWQTPVDLSVAGANAVVWQVAVDPAGNAVTVWTRNDGTNSVVQGAVRPATSGLWQAPVDLSAAGQTAGSPQLAVDPAGNAVAVWQRLDSSANYIMQAAGYDAAGPLLQGLSAPATGTAGQPLSLSVAPLDVWSALGATSWSFGDGGAANATSVTHAYAAPGSYQVTVTSADVLANTTTATRTITITPGPGPGIGPAPGPTSASATPLAVAAVAGLRLAPAAFRAARSGPSATTAAVQTATQVSYTVNVPADARFTVQRAASGRSVTGRCTKPTRGNRTRKRCTRFLGVPGSFTRTRPAGADRFTFTGRLTGHALKPGRYLLVATPTANGRTGTPSSASFRIVK
jgi:hypothetical protein